MVYRIASLLAAAALFVGACSDDDPGNETPDANVPDIDASAPDTDASTPDIDASTPVVDAGTADAIDPCTDPTSVLKAPFRSVDAVSTGVLEVSGNAATVDASAGGSPNAADNPYVYLKFTADAVTKVAITDVDSYTDATWDLALKRFVLRVNGGDSGPGGVDVATVEAETLADVTAAPAEGEFTTDDWFSDACTLNEGPIQEPATELSDWYDYGAPGSPLVPKAEVYVLRRADGSMIKFEIKSYAHDSVNAHYEIEWGAL